MSGGEIFDTRVGCRAKLSPEHDCEIVIHGLDDLREAVEKLIPILKLEERVSFLEHGHAQLWGPQWPAIMVPGAPAYSCGVAFKTISCGTLFGPPGTLFIPPGKIE